MSIGRPYAARPDPSAPWRFGCPECGSSTLREKPAGSDRFECSRCGTYSGRTELVDKEDSGE